MNYSKALELVLDKKLMQRKGWQTGNIFIFFVPGSTFIVNRPPLLGIFKAGAEVTYRGHIDLRMADGTIMPYTPSQVDMLAEDWQEYIFTLVI